MKNAWGFLTAVATLTTCLAKQVDVARVRPSINGALSRHMFETMNDVPFDEKVTWAGKEHAPTPFYRRRLVAWERASLPDRSRWDGVYLTGTHMRFNTKNNDRIRDIGTPLEEFGPNRLG